MTVISKKQKEINLAEKKNWDGKKSREKWAPKFFTIKLMQAAQNVKKNKAW